MNEFIDLLIHRTNSILSQYYIYIYILFHAVILFFGTYKCTHIKKYILLNFIYPTLREDYYQSLYILYFCVITFYESFEDFKFLALEHSSRYIYIYMYIYITQFDIWINFITLNAIFNNYDIFTDLQVQTNKWCIISTILTSR